MRAYSLFLILLLFGLFSAAVDDLGMTDQSMQFATAEETATIQEMTEITEITSDTHWLVFAAKMLYKSGILLAKTLLYTLTVIPLLVKLGAPIEIMAIMQTMQTVILGMGVASWWGGRSTKNID